jgi:hypothetical protein
MIEDGKELLDKDAILAFFFVNGSDSRILLLDQILDSSWYGRPVRAGEATVGGERANRNHGGVVICGEYEDILDPITTIEAWLQQHEKAIVSLDGEKTLEIQSAIAPGMGSKFLVIPQSLIRLCSRLDCKIAHQYMRIPSERELAARRRDTGNQ